MFIIACRKACADVKCSRPILTSGMANAERVSFTFDAEWSGLAKTAVFTNGVASVDVLQSSWQDNTISIPHEVLAEAGRTVRVGVYGTNADGVALPTIWVTLGKVRDGADPSGDEAADPTLPIWAQLQAQIGDLSGLTTKAKENLVAAINEAAKTGSGGAGSVDMQVSGGYIQYSNDGGATWENLISVDDLRGEPGKDGDPGEKGEPGADGYSPSATVTETADGAKITITDKDGTTEATVRNGTDGAPGAIGPQGPAGKTPEKGVDYFTAADVQEIANAAAQKVDLSGKQNKITANGILKGDGAGGVTDAAPGADYMPPVAVTTSDNGKFLRVVNGAWAAAEIQNANGEEF